MIYCRNVHLPGAVLVAWAMAAPWGHAAGVECVPEVKYECSSPRCTRVAEGFAHAEAYRYDTRSGVLTACLWSGCFQGKVRRTESGSAYLLSGLLADHRGDRRLVSLHIDDGGRFSAQWHDAAAPVLELGRCQSGARP